MIDQILLAIWNLIKILAGIYACAILIRLLTSPIMTKIKEQKIKKELDEILGLLKDGKFEEFIMNNDVIVDKDKKEITIQPKGKE